MCDGPPGVISASVPFPSHSVHCGRGLSVINHAVEILPNAHNLLNNLAYSVRMPAQVGGAQAAEKRAVSWSGRRGPRKRRPVRRSGKPKACNLELLDTVSACHGLLAARSPTSKLVRFDGHFTG